MKLCIIYCLLSIGALCARSNSFGTVVQQYCLGSKPGSTNKILVLSAGVGPLAVATRHKIALRTFLSSLALQQHRAIDIITEDVVPFEQEKDITYKSYLASYRTSLVKFGTHDYRTKHDTDIMSIFSTIIQELDNLFDHTLLTEKSTWPTPDFFTTNQAYLIMKNHVSETISQLTVKEFFDHLEEQAALFAQKEQFSLIKPTIFTDLQNKFSTEKQQATDALSHVTSDYAVPLMNVVFQVIEHATSFTEVERLIETCLRPSAILAQAGFLQEILVSQQKNNHTVFFARADQTNVVSEYLADLGYVFNVSSQLITIEENKIITIDTWSLINLLMHSFAPRKLIEQQQLLFEKLLDQSTTRSLSLSGEEYAMPYTNAA